MMISTKEQNEGEVRPEIRRQGAQGSGASCSSLCRWNETSASVTPPPRKRGDLPAEPKKGEKELDYHLNGHSPA